LRSQIDLLIHKWSLWLTLPSQQTW